MITCLRRCTSSATQKSWSTLILSRNAETATVAANTASSSTDANLTQPYPLPEVFCGKMKGVQVDYIQQGKDGDCLIDKMHDLVQNGGYMYEYRHLEHVLDEMDDGTKKCFQLKYVSKDRQSVSLVKYLQAELKKTQNPANTLCNKVEFKVAKYALHRKNLENHMANFPRDRYNKKTVVINKDALLDAQIMLMKVDFQRYDWLMNQLRMDPPIYIWLRGPHRLRNKPRDPLVSVKFIRKHRLKALEKAQVAQVDTDLQDLREKKKFLAEQAAADVAAGLAESAHFDGRDHTDYSKLPKAPSA